MGDAPFTRDQRRALLDDYFATLERRADATHRGDPAAAEAALKRIAALSDRYVASVPLLPLSRCPFTERIVHHSLDHYDLDGLWWDYEGRYRPIEQLPPTYLALAGAVKIHQPVAWAPFLCKPGPEVPYVVPRILEHPSVRAVVSSVPVGAHTGYPIFYFAERIPHELRRVNTWGLAQHDFQNEAGEWRWDAVPEWPPEYDYDLGPWIEAGKLGWIAPGDRDLSLRWDPDGCPYLGLTGHHTFAVVQLGKVLWPPMPPEQARHIRFG